jgi:hypothetical protein
MAKVEEKKTSEALASDVLNIEVEVSNEKTPNEKTPKEGIQEVDGVFDFKGNRYQFSECCPNRLQIDGQVYTREELLINEDILVSLIVGENPFVEKV